MFVLGILRLEAIRAVVSGGGCCGGGGGGRGDRYGHRRICGEVQPVEYDFDVGGRHPVLEHGAVVKVGGAGPTVQRAECDPRCGERANTVEPVGIRAQSLLLVGLGDYGAVRPAVYFAALTRIELERLPCLAVVHALVYGNRVGFGGLGAELQVDVSDLVLLAQRQGECDVVGRRERGRRVHRLSGQRLGPPACRVVRIVGISEEGRGVPALRLCVVAHVTRARASSQLAVPLRAAYAARAGRLHVAAVRGVHEIGHAPPGPIIVVARVRRVYV